MAGDDAWKRFREREDEREQGTGSLTLHEKRIGTVQKPDPIPGAPAGSKLDQQVHQAQALIEQIGSLLKMYIAGIERLPPVEKRKQLEQLMATIQAAPKPTPAIQFRVATLNSTYQTHKDKWDRTMKDLETGKIVRRKSS